MIVVPPSLQRPHVFFKDLTCTGTPPKTRRRGEWFVRRGATTDRAVAEDFAAVLRDALDRATAPLGTKVQALQGELNGLTRRFDSALLGAIPLSRNANPSVESEAGEGPAIVDLPSRIGHALRGPHDDLAQDLLQQAVELRAFVQSSEVEWDPRPKDRDEAERLVRRFEDQATELAAAVSEILAGDDEGVFDAPVAKVFSMLGELPNPSGTYNDVGRGLREYPLLILLYTAFITGVRFERWSLLRSLLDTPLRTSRYTPTSHVAEVGFSTDVLHRLFNLLAGQSLCAPVHTRLRRVLDGHVLRRFPYEDADAMFYIGEFVLALAGLEARGLDKSYSVPLPGLYLYFPVAAENIRAFLARRPDGFITLYRYQIDQMLEAFDKNALHAVFESCGGNGLTEGAKKAYDPSPDDT